MTRFIFKNNSGRAIEDKFEQEGGKAGGLLSI
jgi:hypothetical protein